MQQQPSVTYFVTAGLLASILGLCIHVGSIEAAAQRDEKAREQENREIGGLKRNEAHAKSDLAATRADRHEEYKELSAAKAKKAKDVQKRNNDAGKVK